MNKEIIEKYVEEILYNRLKEFEIKENFILEIKENIKEQIYSLIFHWNDIEFRKAVLITGMDEGKFYEPEAEIDIKCFVVVAIRNSYIEQIFSDECQLMGLDEPIDEMLVKTVTQEAIEYFRNIDFNELAKNIKSSEIKDKYGNIVKKYPMAWNALKQLGKCTEKKIIYENKIPKEKLVLEELNNMSGNVTEMEKKNQFSEVQSGINEKFSKEMLEILKYLTQEKGSIFYADCFKMVTRNFEKLLKVIEIILENENYFLTSNYLITNSYIGKRTEIYKAAHYEKEMYEKMKNTEFLFGLSKFHRTILKNYIENIKI